MSSSVGSSKSHSKPEPTLAVEHGAKMSSAEKQRLQRYQRGKGNTARGIKQHGLKLSVKRGEAKFAAAAKRAAQAELLLPSEAGLLEAEGPMERTDRVSQRQVAAAVDEQTARKAYNMSLDRLGPYRLNYTADGRTLLLAGRKGHLAVVDWARARVTQELQVRETVRDATFLRDASTFAVAQHKNLYIYDGAGVELHCLRDHRPQVNRLAFLRYHWLLATVGPSGHLRYLDVSTGANVADLNTRLGECDCLRVNSWNGVVHLGHAKGVVTMWAPNMSEPLVKMLCHKGAVAAIAVDRGGRYMATSGRDGQLKLWDVRTYRPLHSYHTPRVAVDIDISDRGLLAAVAGPSVQVFKDCLSARAKAPYMTHTLPGCVAEGAAFVPFEDVLGVGHSRGFCSMVVPGAGEPNFDALEVNPYASLKQTREAEVAALLEKLPPETIALDPRKVNTVERDQKERQREAAAGKAARLAEAEGRKRIKKKTRGRSKIGKRLAKKAGNVVDEKRQKRLEELEQRRADREKRKKAARMAAAGEKPVYDALARFAPKK